MNATRQVEFEEFVNAMLKGDSCEQMLKLGVINECALRLVFGFGPHLL